VLAVRAQVGKEGERPAALARKFIDSVDALNRDLGIPTQLDALREEDIPTWPRHLLGGRHNYRCALHVAGNLRQADPAGPAAAGGTAQGALGALRDGTRDVDASQRCRGGPFAPRGRAAPGRRRLTD
jgi:hypothetical protein